MKLVVFDRDWADEFSPFGFAIMTDEEFVVWSTYYSKPQDWYFGTNEGYEDEVLYEPNSKFHPTKVKDITQEEVDVITKVFDLKKLSYKYLEAGLFPSKPEEEI